MTLPQRLPWHADQWRTLATALDQARVHHALLLQGAAGLGKLNFAARAAAALLCEAVVPGSERPCGRCRSCTLVAAGSHPDRLELAPEEDRTVIDVDQVRARIAQLSLTPHYGTRRVILVAPADALNRHAANTLLKTLEEPPGGAVFLLVTARPGVLPATVRSRCLALRFTAPAAQVARDWLAAERPADAGSAAALLQWCGGAPLAAVAAAEAGSLEHYRQLAVDVAGILDGALDAVEAAARWRGYGLAQALRWHHLLVAQAMKHNAKRDAQAADVAMQSICGRLDLRQLDRVCEELLELGSALERQLHPGDQLALESLAVTWRDATRQ